MKKVTLLSAAALVMMLGLSNASFAQPGGGYGRGRNPQPDYRQRPAPATPVIIIDADGRRNNVKDYSFNNTDFQQSFDRKQRKRLEKRYGFVPPLVVYVPDRYVNRWGDYVYQGGLVYHKGRDGYFHLDNRYYNDRWDDYSYNDRRNNGGWNDNRGRY